MTNVNDDLCWSRLRSEAEAMQTREPLLRDFLADQILSCKTVTESLATILSAKLDHPALGKSVLKNIILEIYDAAPDLAGIAQKDIISVTQFDPAAQNVITPFLFFKGFHALQTHRIAHALWKGSRQDLALFLQSRCSMVFGVDIHPAAPVGHGVTFDHATGIVIGETARIGNNVLILHNVTLGGKGNVGGDRHPILEDDVIVGAGAKILGRITVGKGAFVAAGSLVLQSVDPDTTVAGVPAKVIPNKAKAQSEAITP